MNYKVLIFIVLLVSFSAAAQDDAAPAPVSPLQAALDNAREAARNDDVETAVGELQKMYDAGFTTVAVIIGDSDLSQLAGNAAYDDLVASMTRQAYPCEHDERFAEFDFWVGDWDVHVAGGSLAGKNSITREQRGCVLMENWTSALGSSGTSINYVDKVTGEWVQIWNDASGSQINIRGGITDEGMLLTGTIHYVANGSTLPFRGLWTPMEDGRVRQYFEQSQDEGETWAPWFEGFYTRTGGAD